MDNASVGSARFPRPGKKFVPTSIGDFRIIGYYSTDGEQNYLADSSRMSYYRAPRSTKVHMDLNQGIESAVRFPEESVGYGSLDHFLEWIARNRTKIRGSGSDRCVDSDFVASGGVLTRLLYTRFAPECEWEIRAAKWKGTIYLCRVVTRSEVQVKCISPSRCFSWGYKFEQYIVSDHPGEEPDTSRPVVEPAQFRCVFERRFGRHRVLFTSEVDGVRSDTLLKDPLPLEGLKFVELKTKRSTLHPGQWKIFTKHVLLRWWAQSFLTGTDETLCGWRDKEGIVHELATYTLDQMIELGQGMWHPQACINQCNKFLDNIAKVVLEECDKAVYKFEKTANGDVRVSRESSSRSFVSTAFLARMEASGAAQ